MTWVDTPWISAERAAVVEFTRRSSLARWAADGQQPTAVGTNTIVGESWRIVGGLGR